MAKPKRKRRRPGQGSGPVAGPDAALDELETRLHDLASADPAAAGPLWGAVHKLLLKAKADPGAVGRLVATRDVAGLERLMRTMRGEEVEAPVVEAADAPPTPDIPIETRKKAMRAFRKRMKLTRLDHESKLGVGPMTGGKKADVDAILAPQEFPQEVWDALVADGRLKRLSQGFYMLGDEG